MHPRVLLSPEELPEWKKRLQTTESGKAIVRTITDFLQAQRPKLEALAALTPATITPEAVTKYWVQDDQRNQSFFFAATLGWLNDDPVLTKLSIDAVTNYCRLILKAQEISAEEPPTALHTMVTSGAKSTTFWRSKAWDLGSGWLNGDIGLALTYDFAFNQMTPEQRSLVRGTISAVTTGRRSWGMGEPSSRIVSNWSLYHGHLPVTALAIEGEEGYDPEIYKIWVEMVGHYLDQAIYSNGAAQEDSYPLGTSLRDSAPTMVAMARRGVNYFEHPHYQAFLGYVLQSLEPFPGGTFLGHGAGSGTGYPAFWVTARYAMPTNPLANHLWRWYAGENYRAHLKWESYADLLLFSTDWDAAMRGSLDPAQLGLPRGVYYPGRGQMISRSDWGPEALYAHLDARTDAFFVGHDNSDRGTFTVTALGKTWAPDLDWMGFQYSDEHSLVQIDGRAEAWKAPPAKWLQTDETPGMALGAVDLKYAYDWQWPPPWPKPDEKFPAPWEPEPSDPHTLGMPDTPEFAWIPHRLHDEPNVGFAGLNFWRRPFNPVQKAFRSLALVRGAHPYLLVVDDVRKDDSPHRYDWFMQLANDVEIKTQNGDDTVLGLKDAADKRRLLVRLVPPEAGWGKASPTTRIETYLGRNSPGKGPDKGKHLTGTRLIITRDAAVDLDFKVVILPFVENEPLPTTVLSNGVLRQRWSDQASSVALTMGPEGRTSIALLAADTKSGNNPNESQ